MTQAETPTTVTPAPAAPVAAARFRPGRGTAAGVGLACGLLAFVLYSGAINNEFVWDDPIVMGQQLSTFQSPRDALFPPPRIPQFGLFYYRPMITLSYMFDRAMDNRLWNDTKVAFHVPVILFHVLNTICVFLIGRRLFGKDPAALAAAAAAGVLFAVHPIHTESVCWMAGRSDTMAALFVLPATLVYWRWSRDRIEGAGARSAVWLVLAAALFLGGLLSKESAIGMAVVLIGSDLLGVGGGWDGIGERAGARDARSGAQSRSGRGGGGKRARREARSDPRPDGRAESAGGRSGSGRRTVVSYAPAMLAGWAAVGIAVVVYLRLRSLGLRQEGAVFRRQTPELLDSIVNLLKAAGFYLSKIFVPVNLDAFIPTIPNPGWSLALGVVAIVGCGAAAWIAWRGRERRVLLLLAWFAATLAPSLAIAWFAISEAPVAERYLYVPSAAFCLLAGYVLYVKLPTILPPSLRGAAPWGAAVVLLCVGGAFAAGTVRREQAWQSDLEFWKQSVARSPNEGLPRLHLGLAYAAIGEKSLAEKEYLKALDATVEYDTEGRSIALNNLGMLYMGTRELDRADEYFRQSARMRPDYATPYYGLGVTASGRADDLARVGRLKEAEDWAKTGEENLRRAIQLNPQYLKAHNQLAHLLIRTGRAAQAAEHVQLVLRMTTKGPEHDLAMRLRSEIGGAGDAAPSEPR